MALKNLFGDLSLEATQVAIRNLLNTLLGKVTKVDTDDVHISNFPETQNVSGSVSVPGVATESTQQSINSKTPSLGQSNKAGSVPVTIASDQGNVNVSVSNPFATESTLASIDGKLPTIGQKTSYNSVSVVVSSDQPTIPVSVSGIATELS